MNSLGKVEEEECYGCEACVQSCPQKCILLKENSRGFNVPIIDLTKCKNCGICKRVCPYKNETNRNGIQKSYVAVNKNKKILYNSTSGGIFYELAKKVLNYKGSVYGVTLKDKVVKHIKIDNIKDLDLIMKSKYVQSQISDCFNQVKNDLENNKFVLFSGTGCQISGLIRFLSKKYDNLITVEVACHGVPSPGLFNKYLKKIEEKENKNITNYIFRNKNIHKRGEHFNILVYFDDGSKKNYFTIFDPYYSAFLSGKILRKTCYNCKFKTKERVADITLCDFWGIENVKKSFRAQNGSSAVLLNSMNGVKLFNQCLENIYVDEVDYKKIYEYNKSLIESTNIKNFIEYDLEDYNLFENIKNRVKILKLIKEFFPERLKYYLKRMKRSKNDQ